MVLKLVLNEDVERRFREKAMRKFGFSKGSLKKASEFVINKWLIDEKEEKLPKVKDPIKLIDGILSHLKGKYTSVELQHEALKLWAK
ncbi:hypothetical protein HY837_00170 [archaeon]|nr:hypothetical protein [archaeon]